MYPICPGRPCCLALRTIVEAFQDPLHEMNWIHMSWNL